MSDGRIEIGYWSIRGLAAPLRMMCEYTGAAYHAKNYDIPEKDGVWDFSSWFGSAKGELQKVNPLMNLPYIKDVDGTVVTQSSLLPLLGAI